MKPDPKLQTSLNFEDEVDPFEALRLSMAESARRFAEDPELEMNLGEACVRALARRPGRIAIIDNTDGRKTMQSGLLLAVAWTLANRWRRTLEGTRVGVVLPPGIGATVVNLALVILGRIPVNLNFTIGTKAAHSCIQQSGLTTVVTATKLMEKYPHFPWPGDIRDITTEIKACSKPAIVARTAMIRSLPVAAIVRMTGVPREGGDRELGLLFTSGSSGDPKGVALTHRNIMANALQIQNTGILPRGCLALACLPVFHSFGFTVTMWYPLVADITIVSYPSPLDTRRLAEIIETDKVDVLIGSATFLRPFLRRAKPEQLASLRFAVAGAERLPDELYKGFLDRFGVEIMQGYGLTETSPVVSVNRPADLDRNTEEVSRLGSVGLLIPGVEAKIISVDGQMVLPLGASGVLCVKGPNIFSGYLNSPELSSRVLQNGWFVTGDVGRFDEDGFLFIEGRLSRFSKIGGEMVPHVLVEEQILRVCRWDSLDEQVAVVLGVPDFSKGESLVLLTSRPVRVSVLRTKLLEAGLPNLWIPRSVHKVEGIPILATGKCDLRACQDLAEELGKA